MLRPPPIGRSDENGSSSEKDNEINETQCSRPQKSGFARQNRKDLKSIEIQVK